VVRFDERQKDLLTIVQLVGLIPGQELASSDVSPNPAESGTIDKLPEPKKKIESSKPPGIPKESAPAVKKPAIPDEPALKEAENLVHEIFKEEYKKKSQPDKL